MRTFGGFKSGDRSFYGEVIGDDVHILKQPYWLGLERAGETVKLTACTIALPVAPSKLIAVGLNYADHIAEMKRTPLGTPLIWLKAPTSLLPHRDSIEIAFPEHKTDFEVELVIVIGRGGKNISRDRVAEHVFGYTVGLDISDRVLQEKEKQFARAKSFDTYSPIGPFVYSEVETDGLTIQLSQNGQVRQQANTDQMIYSVGEIVAFCSENLTLLPGDVIFTGTPSGVGPIAAGDELEARIGDWPALQNRVARAGSAS